MFCLFVLGECEQSIGYIGQEWHDAMESLDNDLFCQEPTGKRNSKFGCDDNEGYHSDVTSSSDESAAVKGEYDDQKELRLKMIKRIDEKSRRKHRL